MLRGIKIFPEQIYNCDVARSPIKAQYKYLLEYVRDDMTAGKLRYTAVIEFFIVAQKCP